MKTSAGELRDVQAFLGRLGEFMESEHPKEADYRLAVVMTRQLIVFMLEQLVDGDVEKIN